MIPISADERIRVEDDGVIYLTQPITGSNELEYLDLIDQPAGESLSDKCARVDSLFDWFVKGWEGTGVPAFPEDGKPSRFLRTIDKNRILNKIYDLCKLSEEDKKN